MGLDNYVPVMVRVKHFRADNAGKEILIKTDAIVSYEKEAAHFRAEIQIEGKVVSVAHSLATDLGDSKAFEKAETSSIGRALALLGYEADDSISDDESEELKAAVVKKGSLGGGLSRKRQEPVKESKESEEKETEPSKPETPAPAMPKKPMSPPAKLTKTTVSESEEKASESEKSEEIENKQKPETPNKAAPNSKLSDIMNKYGLKGKGA